MTIQYPPIAKRMDAVKDWACWATGENVVWRDMNDGGRVREPNEVWCELRPTTISKIGVDEIRIADIDNEAGDAQFPMQEATYSVRLVDFELRAKSRSQEHDQSAWMALFNAHLKVYNNYGRCKFLSPGAWSVVDISDIQNMPTLENHDLRVEDIAILSLSLSTAILDIDAAAIGTWIESIEIGTSGTGNVGPTVIKDAGGITLPASLQLEDEVMP